MAVFTNDELRLFDGYIQNTLAAGERLWLEQQLSGNKEVHNRFTLYHTIVHLAKEEAGIEGKLKERFKKLDKKLKQRRWFPLFSIAASVIGVALFLFILRSSQKNIYSGLATYKIEEPGLPVIMGEEESSNWTTIMQRYKQKEYSDALQLVQQKPVTDTSLYFAGLLYELTAANERAINRFQKLQTHYQSSIFADKAAYRLALLLWEKGEMENAKNILKTIAENPSHIYHPQAQKIIQEDFND